MNENLEKLEANFRAFLNRTIKGASIDYYKEQIKYLDYELHILNNDMYLKDAISHVNKDISCIFDDFGDNYVLECGIKSLSYIERTVIFLYFKKCLSTGEIARIIDIREQSVSRIKRRALDKLKMFMKGYGLNG